MVKYMKIPIKIKCIVDNFYIKIAAFYIKTY